MTEHSLEPWQRSHFFLASSHSSNARRTQWALALTIVMMVAEIVCGTLFGSMALLADGWHMGSHAAALGIAAFAYYYAHRHADNAVYTFGTGKVGDLGGFASALVLAVIALMMAYESIDRLLTPVPIAFHDAIGVAVLGLVINLVTAWMLKDDHSHHGHDHGNDHGPAQASHDHDHDHAHSHEHHDHEHHDHAHHGHEHHAHQEPAHQTHGEDHNMRAAYVHVLADALTSLLAIGALVAGLFWGWNWLDPAIGIVGSIIIGRWAWSLLGTTGRILLDADPSATTTTAVRKAIEGEPDNRIADLHVWRVGPGHLAAVLTVVTHEPRPPGHYKAMLANIPNLSHVTVEVERCCTDKPQAA